MKDRANEIAKNLKYDGYQRTSAIMVYKFFGKKTGSGIRVSEQLAEELHKPVIRKINRWKIYARFKDNIWAGDLPEMGSLSPKNKTVRYLLCVIYYIFI